MNNIPAALIFGGGSGGGGAESYSDLSNKPKINGNELIGDKSAADLGLTGTEFFSLPDEEDWEDETVIRPFYNQLKSAIDNGKHIIVVQTWSIDFECWVYYTVSYNSVDSSEEDQEWINLTNFDGIYVTALEVFPYAITANEAEIKGNVEIEFDKTDIASVKNELFYAVANSLNPVLLEEVGHADYHWTFINSEYDESVGAITGYVFLCSKNGELHKLIIGNNFYQETIISNQASTMPTANVYNLGQLIQYTGVTTADYTNGFFYKCEESSGTYSWKVVNVQSSVDVVDNLTSTSTEDALSANQGRVLNEKNEVVSASVNQNWQGNGYNLIPYPNLSESKTDTDLNVTFTANSDGSITLNTADDEEITRRGDYDIIIKQNIGLKKSKRYRLSGCPSGGSSMDYHLYCQLFDEYEVPMGMEQDFGDGVIFDALNEDITLISIKIKVGSGIDYDNLTFYPMLVEVDDDGNYPTEYQRYAMGNVELTDKVSNIQEPTVTWENCTPLAEGTHLQVKNGVGYLSAHLNNVNIEANTWKSFGTIPEGFRPNKANVRFIVLIDGTTKACKGHITSTGIIGIYSSEEITEGSSAFVFNLSYIIN